MITIVLESRKNLYNGGQCFTKGMRYEAKAEKPVNNVAQLQSLIVLNDLGEPHRIGAWHRYFSIINNK